MLISNIVSSDCLAHTSIVSVHIFSLLCTRSLSTQKEIQLLPSEPIANWMRCYVMSDDKQIVRVHSPRRGCEKNDTNILRLFIEKYFETCLHVLVYIRSRPVWLDNGKQLRAAHVCAPSVQWMFCVWSHYTLLKERNKSSFYNRKVWLKGIWN